MMHHLYSIATAFFFIEIYMLHYRIPALDRKPFNCMACFSGWCTFAQLVGIVDVFTLAGEMMITMLAATVFYNLFKRYT